MRYAKLRYPQIRQGAPTGRPVAGLHGRACHDSLNRPRINDAAARRFRPDFAIFSGCGVGEGAKVATKQEALPSARESATRGNTTTPPHRAVRNRAGIELAFRAWPRLPRKTLSHGKFKELRHRRADSMVHANAIMGTRLFSTGKSALGFSQVLCDEGF
jgi:hypothetical protein